MELPRIRPLDEAVVNRIAAGEIVLAPSSALKEMLENSIDAGASSIDVACKDGGLKLLQITDNGSGIAKEDLAIVCERFTTSKLRKFEDLQHISTYGFRGEALASISHIAHLSVITKTADDSCAWKCLYKAGKVDPPLSQPQAVAGKDGTTITVEDLFFNFPSRLNSLRSPSEEYAKILDVVSRYAVHTTGVGFTCKKYGTTANDITIRANVTQKERIRAIYGSSVASDLLEFSVEPEPSFGLSKCSGYVTNVNFDNKKSIAPIFFINGRLVTCDPLRRALQQTYNSYLPKGHKPFVYLSLELDSTNVDVNVHPTKREVRFLFEDEIVDHISAKLAEVLSNVDVSRTFLTQQLLPSPKRVATNQEIVSSAPKKARPLPTLSQYKRPSEHKLVRTDFSQSTISTYLPQQSKIETSFTEGTQRTKVKLKSIFELKHETEQKVDKRLLEIFSRLTFIGVVDSLKRLMCFQYDVNLFMADYGCLCYELFYQIGLSDFSNFGTLRLSQPVSIDQLLVENGLDHGKDTVVSVFVEMKDMLLEYFSIEIDTEQPEDPRIVTLPLLAKGYVPDLGKLALFVFRCGTKVNWDDEKECLGGIIQQLALLYVPGAKEDDAEIASTLETVICPLLKSRFLPSSDLKPDVVEIANLPGLYKVFERC
ncbi:hypothetical protein OGAPHI_001728 [Ogataea philodendri]|uniref:DNA mismatch repair protein S5 domain-containing protein n=1 Tax=Ogataea philodendri TaxID=1378263 RepID=A0A9P8PAM4_9ASCO|nr:uncharacterized protein OGAPHI_001728 [Ogataea philodendri]KAH3667974.1 hypothetical protein OGAPHI_001728 [Ogataea philodendri]